MSLIPVSGVLETRNIKLLTKKDGLQSGKPRKVPDLRSPTLTQDGEVDEQCEARRNQRPQVFRINHDKENFFVVCRSEVQYGPCDIYASAHEFVDDLNFHYT